MLLSRLYQVRALFDVHAVGSQLLLCHVPRAGNDHTHVVEAGLYIFISLLLFLFI